LKGETSVWKLLSIDRAIFNIYCCGGRVHVAHCTWKLEEGAVEPRFEIIKEPSGAWTVFDTLLGIPAQVGATILSGLTADEAAFAKLQCEYPSTVSKLLRFSAHHRL
jgi:hypothetical protein